jgi:hypothetical protein
MVGEADQMSAPPSFISEQGLLRKTFGRDDLTWRIQQEDDISAGCVA